MLNVDVEILNKMAELPVEHSWLLPIMQLPTNEAVDNAEWNLNQWIKEEVAKLYPNTYDVERMVRNGLPYLLESKAVEMAAEQGLAPTDSLLWVETTQEAVEVAAMDIMYVSQEEKKKAAEFMQMVLDGEIKHPDVEALMK